MPITFNFLMQKWKYEFYSSQIEIYNGKEYQPIIIADTEEKVFKKDFIALGIIIKFLEENEEELK